MRGRARAAALIATVAVLVTADVASAGLLEADASGNLLYTHLSTFEDLQAHDIVFEPDGAGYRLTDAGADIAICNIPGFCLPPPCVPGAGPREVLCAAVPTLQIVLGDLNDRLENHTAVPLFACGGTGSDVLIGGSGADTLGGGGGRDDVRGGGGNDFLAVDVERVLAFDPATPPPPACGPGPIERFELLDGGSGRDRLEGGPGDDLIDGGGDDDTLIGYAGDDRMGGGPGRDDLAGLEGDDRVHGDEDGDFLFGGPGSDDLDGGAGDDDLGRTLRYDADGLGTETTLATAVEDGDDRLDGGAGSDHLTAGPGSALFDPTDSLARLESGIVDRRLVSPALNGADRFIGGPGDDLVTYVNRDLPVSVSLDGLANDGSAGEADRVDADVERIWGGARADVLRSAPPGSLLLGDLGADVLVGGAGPDRLIGGGDDGADTLTGAGGDDQLIGAPGDDTLDGGPGSDTALGGSGDDEVAGGPGADRLEGGAGSDRLDGGADVDCLHGFVFPAAVEPACVTGLSPTPVAGADGADVLLGGPGVDRLWGGAGDDVADYSETRSPVVVVLPGGADTAGAAADVLAADVLAADVEGARGGRGADVLIGNAADNVMDGGPGDDHVDGAGGVDRLRGGSGQDVIVARDGEPDAVRCGTKRDLALIDGDDEVVAALSDVCERVDGGGSALGPSLGPAGVCAVTIRPPGATRWFPLRLRASLPPHTVVDVSSCPARVGRAVVRSGAFALEPSGRRLVLALRGGQACPNSGRRIRRLDVRRAPAWLAIRGRDLTVTGAGASWTTVDGCRRTRVKVRSGRVRTAR